MPANEVTRAVNWDAAKVLYAQGVRPQEIAKRLGIPLTPLYGRISKGNWSELLTISRDSTDQALQALLKESDSRFRSALAKQFDLLSEALPTQRVTLPKALQLQRDLVPALSNARTLYGWSDNGTTKAPMVRINVLGTAVVQSDVPQKESLIPSATDPKDGGQPL